MTLDIFTGRPFSMTSLTGRVSKMDYVPDFLGNLGVFRPKPIRTRNFFIDRDETTLRLIATSAIGTPLEQRERNLRNAVNMITVRLGKETTLYAEELQGVRETGSEEAMDAMVEFTRRQGEIVQDFEYTEEHHRLGALHGVVYDADGTSVIENLFDRFGVTAPTPFNFALPTASTDVRLKCAEVLRHFATHSKGVLTPATQIHALCGHGFYDALITHPKVERMYENHAKASMLGEAKVYDSFTFGGITFHDYRGSDDGTTVAVDTDECRFFPVGGGQRMFEVAYAPAEFMPFVNKPGQRLYAMRIMDRDRAAWVKGEIYSYSMHYCTRPDLLLSATRS